MVIARHKNDRSTSWELVEVKGGLIEALRRQHGNIDGIPIAYARLDDGKYTVWPTPLSKFEVEEVPDAN